MQVRTENGDVVPSLYTLCFRKYIDEQPLVVSGEAVYVDLLAKFDRAMVAAKKVECVLSKNCTMHSMKIAEIFLGNGRIFSPC